MGVDSAECSKGLEEFEKGFSKSMKCEDNHSTLPGASTPKTSKYVRMQLLEVAHDVRAGRQTLSSHCGSSNPYGSEISDVLDDRGPYRLGFSKAI